MENFVYYAPTKLLFGKGQLDNVAQEILPYGKKILFLYGEKHLKQTGVHAQVTGMLKKAGITFVELGGVHPNPRLDLVRKGMDICRREKIEFILAVGGGSTSDTAKAIAAGTKASFDIFQAYQDFRRPAPDSEKKIPAEALPIGVVITKAATGSEFDLTSVITKWEDGSPHEKLLLMNPVLYPRFAICDPTLTYTLPKDQTAYGIADMMTHYFEQYFTPSANTEFLDRMKEAVLMTVITCGPNAIKKPDDYVPRADLMYAAMWSCSAQNITGVVPEWTSHFIEHEITALTDLQHGLGMAIVFPAWMSYVIESDPRKFSQFAVRIWKVKQEGRNDIEVGREGIERLRKFWASLGIPGRLSEVGVTKEMLPVAAKQAARFGTMGSLRPVNEQDVLRILELAF